MVLFHTRCSHIPQPLLFLCFPSGEKQRETGFAMLLAAQRLRLLGSAQRGPGCPPLRPKPRMWALFRLGVRGHCNTCLT